MGAGGDPRIRCGSGRLARRRPGGVRGMRGVRIPAKRRAVAALAVAWLAGCGLFKIGPDYVTPEAATAPQWIDYKDPRIQSEETDLSSWWSVFNDPALEALVDQASRENLTLKAAVERIHVAQARLKYTAGNLYPQDQAAFGGFTAARGSKEAANFSPTLDATTTNWEFGLAASWELDLWGVVRRAIESADAELQASIADYDDVLVLLFAEVARNFVLYRTFEERLVHVRGNLEVQERSYELTQEKFKAGAVTERDVQQAKQILEQTRSRIPPLLAGLRQASNALSVLLGSPPRDLSETLGVNGPIPTVPASVAIGIPADLLRRRPDVRRSERLAAAQSAHIGIAKGEYYPHFSITGTIGYRADDFGDLFNGSALFGAIGPSFRWNILQYGRTAALVEGEEAAFRVRVAEFQDTVLRAGQEADDAATLFLSAQDEAAALAESVTASRRTVEITIDQYKAGAVDFTPVFLFQATLTEQEDSLAALRGQIALNLIALYRALGGGWEMRLHENP